MKRILLETTGRSSAWRSGTARHKEIWQRNDDLSNSVTEKGVETGKQKQGEVPKSKEKG